MKWKALFHFTKTLNFFGLSYVLLLVKIDEDRYQNAGIKDETSSVSIEENIPPLNWFNQAKTIR